MGESEKPVFLTRKNAMAMLGLSKHEFASLVSEGKLHPIKTTTGHDRVSLAEIISLKAEFSARALATPYEKFIQAASFFCANAQDINRQLSTLGLPTVPTEYINRLRTNAEKDPDPGLIKVRSAREFFTALGRAEEILKHPDLKLMAELLHMVNRGEEEIRQTIRAKYGREYGVEDVARYLEYFYNWRIMDPDSARFYFQFLPSNSREHILKVCAFRRADYFIFYALGIDFGGEVADLIERSCLGLLHKLNIYVDGFVYGDLIVGQADIQKLADIISTLLGAAAQVRAGRVPKSKQNELVDTMVPKTFTRAEFFKAEKATTFAAKEPESA